MVSNHKQVKKQGWCAAKKWVDQQCLAQDFWCILIYWALLDTEYTQNIHVGCILLRILQNPFGGHVYFISIVQDATTLDE
jgi:hypothetical protein